MATVATKGMASNVVIATAPWNSAFRVISAVIRSWLMNIRFWYFADVEALGYRAVGSMDPSKVPNALAGHHWTFLFTIVATVATLPYATQPQQRGSGILQPVLKPIDVTFLLLGLFLSTVTASVRQTYLWRTHTLEREYARLSRRYKNLERRFNVWPLPATRQVSALLISFETHKLAVIESGSFMLLTSLVVTAIHAGLITQSILRLSINYQLIGLQMQNVLFPYNLIALINMGTLLDYVLRVPIITRFQWVYCLTHFPPIQPPAEAG